MSLSGLPIVGVCWSGLDWSHVGLAGLIWVGCWTGGIRWGPVCVLHQGAAESCDVDPRKSICFDMSLCERVTQHVLPSLFFCGAALGTL